MRRPHWHSRPLAFVAGALALACEQQPTAPLPTAELDPIPTFAIAATDRSGTWETRAPMPSGRLNFGAGVIPNARGETIFYTISGQSGMGDATSNVVQAYNPISNTWANKARLPAHRAFPNGTGVMNGKLYLPGGFEGADQSGQLGASRRELFVYDAATNAWSQRRMMPVSSAGGVSAVINGQLYVLTGARSECRLCPVTNTRSLYRYNPATDIWNKLAGAPRPHVTGVGGVINGKFYVAGGGEWEKPTTHLDVYDPATNTWTSKASMPFRERQPGIAGAVVGEKLYVTGGGTNIVDAYDPATDKWTRQADAPDPARWDQVAGTIRNSRGDEQLIVAGAAPAEPHFGPGETWVYTPHQEKIAFITNRDGNSEIYLMRADGRLQKNLSNSPAEDFGHDWSPSGNRIAFQSSRDGNAEIYTMSINGLDQVNLTRNPGLDGTPQWSPDGRKIAFHSNRNGSFDIFVMNRDGTGQTRLTSAAGNDFNPMWSPDGSRIVFSRHPEEPGSTGDVWVVNANGTGETNLTNSPDAEDSGPSWSPNGSKILFIRGAMDGSQKAHVMNPDGSGLTSLSGNVAHEHAPEWSPDGRRIVLDRGRDIWVLNADGSNQRQLTNTAASEILPHWSPDGSRIAFVRSGSDGNTEIYVMWQDGNAQRNISRRPSGESQPLWQP